ncbi:MAG: queuosine precursor transporter [Bacteroides sp.]
MREKVSVPFMLLGILFNVCLIAANLLETKVVQVGSLTVTAGLLVFPVSYIINDCIAEVWGFKKARLIIWSGFAMNFFVVSLGLIAVALPAAPFWEGGEHFNFVFGMAPRIVAASLMAFLVGSFLNAYVMSRMKVASGGRHFSVRAIWSTIVGETADSLIFFPIAFGGVIAWQELCVMMGVQIVLKSAYEVLVLPVTIRVVKAIKKVDGSDVYDRDISYNVWKIKDLSSENTAEEHSSFPKQTIE